nr:hypothetical protein [Endozoicomonas ascidiicola]
MSFGLINYENTTNSMLCTLIHMTKNQLEVKRSEIAGLSQYTTKVIRESYNSEVEELVTIQQFLDGQINNSQEPQTARPTKK